MIVDVGIQPACRRKRQQRRGAPSKGDSAPSSLLFSNPASITDLARRLSVATVVGYLH